MRRNLERERKRKQRRKLKQKQLPYLKLLKLADAVFSKWIRNRDDWKCLICGATEQIQNGHLIPRGNKSVRFDPYNCSAICSFCNYRDNYWHFYYEVAFLKRYGAEEMVKLSERANVKIKLTRQDLEEIIRKYSV